MNTPSPPASCKTGKFNVDLTNEVSSPVESCTAAGNDDSIVQLDMEDEVQVCTSSSFLLIFDRFKWLLGLESY